MPWRIHLGRRIFNASQAALVSAVLLEWSVVAQPATSQTAGTASWYGEAHRGRFMANGKPFNPDELTAASWFYPLQTRLRVTCRMAHQEPSIVVVTVTDRGPARRLVKNGRIIDLSRSAFEKLAPPAVGLIYVSVRPEPQNGNDSAPVAIVSDQASTISSHQSLFSAIQGAEQNRLAEESSRMSSGQKELREDELFCFHWRWSFLYEATAAQSGPVLCRRNLNQRPS